MHFPPKIPLALALLTALAAAVPAPYYYIDHVDELRAKGMSEVRFPPITSSPSVLSIINNDRPSVTSSPTSTPSTRRPQS
jgi:hypothetical protein